MPAIHFLLLPGVDAANFLGDLLRQFSLDEHINRIIEELQTPFDDGNHIIYVNGAYKNDASDIGKLMHDFRCTSSIDMFYDVLKRGMHHFKETEGGRTIVCKAIETYGEQMALETRIENALKMIARGKLTLEEIAEDSGLSLEKVKELADKRTA